MHEQDVRAAGGIPLSIALNLPSHVISRGLSVAVADELCPNVRADGGLESGIQGPWFATVHDGLYSDHDRPLVGDATRPTLQACPDSARLGVNDRLAEFVS